MLNVKDSRRAVSLYEDYIIGEKYNSISLTMKIHNTHVQTGTKYKLYNELEIAAISLSNTSII